MVTEITNHLPLTQDRHPQHDLFVCDVADAALKEMTSVMEHPFYSLSKRPETAVRRYEHEGNWVEVVPSVKGLATIYDKDILIYCVSQLIAKERRGETPSRKVRLNARELLMFTNRGTSGRDYAALCEALDRLDGTRVRTNVRRDGGEEFQAFGLIDSASVARKLGLDGRLLWCEVTLSEWVFDAVRQKDVLTLHRDYFRLRKPLERRTYELARKHCGSQNSWSVGVPLLWKKSGSKSPLKHFRYLIKDLAKNDHLPDYAVRFDEHKDQVAFHNRHTMRRAVKETIPPLSPTAYEEARGVAPGWDPYALEHEWRAWAKGRPRDPDAAFVGFCKSWFAKRGRP